MRDYIDVLASVEATIPSAIGGTSRDDVLRQSLVSFANETIAEVDRESRWSLSYSEVQIDTSDGVNTYKLNVPASSLGTGGFEIDRVKRIYYIDGQKIARLSRINREDAQRMFAEGAYSAAQITGKPRYYSIEFTPFDNLFTTAGSATTGTGAQSSFSSTNSFFPYTLFLYPTPDNSGPGSGGGGTYYPLRIGANFNTPYIVETTGTVAAAATALTVPSTVYLQRNLVPTNGTAQKASVSIRGAGPAKNATTNDTLISSWSAMPSATGVTLDTAATTSVTTAQAFFHSTNWMIRFWPKLIQFGMQREIAQYYENDASFQLWDKRFQEQLDKARNWDADRARGAELMAAGLLGAGASALSRSDMRSGWGDYGGWW